MGQFNKLTPYIEGSANIVGNSILLKCDKETPMSVLVSLKPLLRNKSGTSRVYIDFKGGMKLTEGTVNPKIFPTLIKTLFSKNIQVFYINNNLEMIPMDEYVDSQIELNLNSIFDASAVNF